MKYLLLSFFAFTSSLSFAAPWLQQEIKELNSVYNSYQSYPIIIFDKEEIIPKLQGIEEEEKIRVIQNYIDNKIKIFPSESEASNMLLYLEQMKGSASALPIERDIKGVRNFCAVFPAYNQNNLEQEMLRVLGADQLPKIYEGFPLNDFTKNYKLEELQLFSLYHELSHCLHSPMLSQIEDQSAHTIHLNESFAESMALFLLMKNKGLSRLGQKRAQLRTLYSKYMGKYLATSDDLIVIDDLIRLGGGIYFLSPVLMASQRLIEQRRDFLMGLSTEELVFVVENLVASNALTSRQIAAMNIFYQKGSEATLKQYHDLAHDMPDLMQDTYLFLQSLDLLFKNIN